MNYFVYAIIFIFLVGAWSSDGIAVKINDKIYHIELFASGSKAISEHTSKDAE